MNKVPSPKTSISPTGYPMASKSGSKVDKSVFTPDTTGLSKDYPKKGSMPTKMLSCNETVPVAGKNLSK